MTSNARILIVCIDSNATQSLTDRLHGLGHTVSAAAPGREGFERAGNLDPHLALIDLEDARGIEAAAELVRRVAVPIVYVVGDVDEPMLKRARETDPFGYVIKPVDSRQLRLTIDAALSRRPATRPEQETGWRLGPELEDRNTVVETMVDTDRLVAAAGDGRFTDLNRRIEDLHEQADLMRTAFDNMSDGMVVLDQPGRVVLVNKQAWRIANFEEHEDFDQWRKRTELLDARDMSPCAAEDRPVARVLRGEPVEDCELVVRRSHQPRDIYVTVNGMPLRRRDGTLRGAVILFRDVTDSKLQGN